MQAWLALDVRRRRDVLAPLLKRHFVHADEPAPPAIPVDTDPVYTYSVRMNVTLSIDDRVVAEARRIAALRGTSLNQLVRNYLHELTGTDDAEAVVARLDALWAEESHGSERSWTREELHERS